MIIAVDFDGTVVRQDHAYDDFDTPLQFIDGADSTIPALKRADHVLLLWSARASRALLYDPTLNPLVRAGVVKLDMDRWKKSQAINIARYQQMLVFVHERCNGWFDAIDTGEGGKPLVDAIIDDKALRLGRGMGGHSWYEIGEMYGAVEALAR